ncbi:hypothetical protein [uncultured Aquimarina sp.]|uniref:hypothetical protein n=1 Tax=uncultured Aquimarina sp. TaxID=575652 RepID=UPI002614408E|nr:hypothetical protein [uncultured Aquimarina sp.]
MKKKYSKEVEKLFSYGSTDLLDVWPNYIKDINLEEKHCDELIDVITSSDLSKAISGFTIQDFGPRHAWRALGQLKSKDAVTPLLDALTAQKNEEAFDFRNELPKVLLLIGDEIIPELQLFLNNDKIEWNFKVIIFEALVNLAKQEVAIKDVVVGVANDLFISNTNKSIFLSRLLNLIFPLKPYDSEVIKDVIDKDKYDVATINHEEILKFIEESKMYE